MGSAIKSLSAIQFNTPSSFKKKANNANQSKSSFMTNPLKTLRNLIKSKAKKLKNRRKISVVLRTPRIGKFHRNKAKTNYTNKSSHLSNVKRFQSQLADVDIVSNNNALKPLPNKNKKKMKRMQRREQLKTQ